MSGSSRARAGGGRTDTQKKDIPATGLAAPVNPARIAALFGLVVLGAVVGIAGTLVQAAWFPGGLLLATAAAAASFTAAAR